MGIFLVTNCFLGILILFKKSLWEVCRVVFKHIVTLKKLLFMLKGVIGDFGYHIKMYKSHGCAF